MDNQNGKTKIREKIGLFFIKYVFNWESEQTNFKKEFEEYENTEELIAQDIVTKKKISSKNVEFAYDFAKQNYDEENKIHEAIENKANNLLGLTGISITFIFGFVGLFSDSFSNFPTLIKILLVLLYIVIVFSLFMTILLAFRVVKVGPYNFRTTNVEDISAFRSYDLENKREQILSLIKCCRFNEEISNFKATILIGAQTWFTNSFILLLCLSLILIIIITFQFSNSNNLESTTITSTITILQTSETVPNTITPMYTETLQSQKTYTPMRTSTLSISPAIQASIEAETDPTIIKSQVNN